MYQNCPQYWALGRVTVRLSPICMNSIHHHSWAGHPDISFTQRSVHLSMPWALQEDPVGNSVKALLNPDKQHPQPFPHPQGSYLVVEGDQVGQAEPAFPTPTWAGPYPQLSCTCHIMALKMICSTWWFTGTKVTLALPSLLRELSVLGI